MNAVSEFEEQRRKEEEAKPLKQHLAETCIEIKRSYQERRFKKEQRKIEKQLGFILPSFSERADRIRRNLMVVAGAAVFYKSFELKITAASTPAGAFLGLRIENLTSAAVDVGLTFLVTYLFAHFFVVALQIHFDFFAHMFGNSVESKIEKVFLFAWRSRWFILESVIPLGLGIWALNLLPFQETLFGWAW